MNKISVIIPAYNAADTIEQCLAPLVSYQSHLLEIIVVNDASTDDTLKIAQRFPIKVISNEQNLGPSQSRNEGIKHASGAALVFIDSDVVVEVHELNKFIKRLEVLSLGHGQSCGLTRVDVQECFSTLYKNIYMNYTFSQVKNPATFLYGSFCGIKSQDKSPWDVSLRYGEDTNLGYKLISNGGSLIFHNDILINHLKRYNILQLIVNDFKIPFYFSYTFLQNFSLIKKDKRDFSHTNKKQLAAILCCGLFLPSLFFSTKVSSLVFISWFLLNRHFFMFLWKSCPSHHFFIRSFLFTIIDQTIMGFGVFLGLLYFSVFKRPQANHFK